MWKNHEEINDYNNKKESENNRKQSDRQILESCQRAEKSSGTWQWQQYKL